jgi:hypothetical protein
MDMLGKAKNTANGLACCLYAYHLSSPNIARVFGKPGSSEGEGLQIVDTLIEEIKGNFIMWNAERDVLTQV